MRKRPALLLAVATLLLACGADRSPARTAARPAAASASERVERVAEALDKDGIATGGPSGGPADDDGGLTQRTCARVIDGDTIELDRGERVRYVGIDTPETKHPRKPVQRMGKEASEANRLLVEGKRVGLEFDVERTDKYGRTLAYVYVGGVMVNERLVKAGYAQVSTYPPNVKYVDRFLAAQREAREEDRGLWGDGADPKSDPLLSIEAPEGATTTAPPAAVQKPTAPAPDADTVYVTRTGKKFHRDGCSYLSRSEIPMARKHAMAQGYTRCSGCKP